MLINISFQCETSKQTLSNRKVVSPWLRKPGVFFHPALLQTWTQWLKKGIRSEGTWRALQSAPLLCQINQASALYDNQHIQYPELEAERRRTITLKLKRRRRDGRQTKTRGSREKDTKSVKMCKKLQKQLIPSFTDLLLLFTHICKNCERLQRVQRNNHRGKKQTNLRTVKQPACETSKKVRTLLWNRQQRSSPRSALNLVTD